jgi:hypothetical protein
MASCSKISRYGGVRVKTSTADLNREWRATKYDRYAKWLKSEKNVWKTFILNFNKSASIYKEEEKLEATAQAGGGMRMMNAMSGGGGTYYKNVKENLYRW